MLKVSDSAKKRLNNLLSLEKEIKKYVRIGVESGGCSGLNYKLVNGTFLRASYGSGFRFPSIVERYVTVKSGPVVVYPNPELEPEGGCRVLFRS